jgi:hypothetical protein
MKRHLRRLPSLLNHDYGHRGPYTPEQVESTIRRHRVTSLAFAPYAMAIFCDREKVEALWRKGDAPHNYDVLRHEIGAAYFGGDAGFTREDMARHSTEACGESSGHHGHDGGLHEESASGGGHH